jgi:hypothetical protein
MRRLASFGDGGAWRFSASRFFGLPVFLKGIVGPWRILASARIIGNGLVINPQHFPGIPLGQTVRGQLLHRLPAVADAQPDVAADELLHPGFKRESEGLGHPHAPGAGDLPPAAAVNLA